MSQFIREVFSIPFGYLIGFFYEIFNNYFLSLLLMTICVKIILLPSSIKQQKGMAKTQRMQPKIKRINEKYATNPQKKQEAMNELYAREGYSSMTGGCAPMLIQLPIMMGVYSVNYKLMSFVLNIPKDIVAKITDAAKALPEFAAQKNGDYQIELFALKHFDKITAATEIPAEYVSKIENFLEGFSLFGVPLSDTPTTSMGLTNPLWLIPILTGVTSFMMAIYTYSRQKKTNPEQAKQMGCMSLSTPIMSIVFSFMFPASVGVYIILSSLLSFVQMIIMNKIYSPKKVLAQTMVNETINRRAREKILKDVAKTLDDDKEV